mmetsp:Transcript_25442/g.67635  ORF Transcript_25442/g.67635 Transcript_25442/m.67635 type:complete len:283 (+) Transcript_25442:2-850(+)
MSQVEHLLTQINVFTSDILQLGGHPAKQGDSSLGQAERNSPLVAWASPLACGHCPAPCVSAARLLICKVDVVMGVCWASAESLPHALICALAKLSTLHCMLECGRQVVQPGGKQHHFCADMIAAEFCHLLLCVEESGCPSCLVFKRLLSQPSLYVITPCFSSNFLHVLKLQAAYPNIGHIATSLPLATMAYHCRLPSWRRRPWRCGRCNPGCDRCTGLVHRVGWWQGHCGRPRKVEAPELGRLVGKAAVDLKQMGLELLHRAACELRKGVIGLFNHPPQGLR